MPKEVGKVGTESSTFIEPIMKRKDGIKAMFSKQKQAQTAKGSTKAETLSPSGSQTKRKHGTDSEYEGVSPKKTRMTKQKVPDDGRDSDIEIMAAPVPVCTITGPLIICCRRVGEFYRSVSAAVEPPKDQGVVSFALIISSESSSPPTSFLVLTLIRF